MSVRLNKICREFNIGLNTIVECLGQYGIIITPTPNTKITDEQYELFRIGLRNLPMKICPWVGEPFTDNAITNRTIINSQGWNNLKNSNMVFWENKIIFFPKHIKEPGLQYWTIEDIKENCPDALKGHHVYMNKLCEPSGTIPVAIKGINEEQKTQSSSLNTNTSTNKDLISVDGKIDLNALNASTRPVPKSKEEKREAREERWGQKRKM